MLNLISGLIAGILIDRYLLPLLSPDAGAKKKTLGEELRPYLTKGEGDEK